jgi:hypothetical protein
MKKEEEYKQEDGVPLSLLIEELVCYIWIVSRDTIVCDNDKRQQHLSSVFVRTRVSILRSHCCV